MSALELYVSKFARLHTARNKGAAAPHKPVLLLSVIAEIEAGHITENRIYITPELVGRFKDYWHQLVHNPIFSPNFSLPFYHLKTEGFWHIHTYLGREILLTSSRSVKSFGQLKEVVDFVSLDLPLYELLCHTATRLVLRNKLLDVYFPGNRISADYKLFSDISEQILHDPPALYKTRAESFDEEEVFVRSGVFKKEIPRIYNYTCCISGMRVISANDSQMVDACHIIPFSESHDDTIGNGLSLCPNLHRAFDRHLITIDEQYKVVVKDFSEEVTPYSIRQFAGNTIALPQNKHHYPSQNNLHFHRERFIHI